MDIEKIRKELKKMLSSKRYVHSLATEEMAAFLAKQHNYESHKVRIASLLHDCAKDLPLDTQKDYIMRYEIVLDEIELKEPKLWHAAISQELAKRKFNIYDSEILQSIRIHPTGDKDMTSVDKIVVLSDYLEPNRNFRDNEKIKVIAMKDLNQATILVLTSKLLHVIKKGSLIHPRTIEARNDLLSIRDFANNSA
ncbi:MAG: bis(5'-nucleosyl)-tetraphosphatase (symmetrical) YqeK [bacterium]|nr:bis(5'-nucleosyl)-tetraphosphatase (symmetrical) YqeK [bacterium]